MKTLRTAFITTVGLFPFSIATQQLVHTLLTRSNKRTEHGQGSECKPHWEHEKMDRFWVHVICKLHRATDFGSSINFFIQSKAADTFTTKTHFGHPLQDCTIDGQQCSIHVFIHEYQPHFVGSVYGNRLQLYT